VTRSGPALAFALMFATAMLAIGLAVPGAEAQTPHPKRKKASVETPAAPPPPPPAPDPHHRPLTELSEIIGALALLAEVCSPGSASNPWRARMERLVVAEGEASGIVDRLRGAFNHGYSDYATSYRTCTPSAKAAAEMLIRDAARLARDIERRFGS